MLLRVTSKDGTDIAYDPATVARVLGRFFGG
jgi:hypothetical protein